MKPNNLLLEVVGMLHPGMVLTGCGNVNFGGMITLSISWDKRNIFSFSGSVGYKLEETDFWQQ